MMRIAVRDNRLCVHHYNADEYYVDEIGTLFLCREQLDVAAWQAENWVSVWMNPYPYRDEPKAMSWDEATEQLDSYVQPRAPAGGPCLQLVEGGQAECCREKSDNTEIVKQIDEIGSKKPDFAVFADSQFENFFKSVFGSPYSLPRVSLAG